VTIEASTTLKKSPPQKNKTMPSHIPPLVTRLVLTAQPNNIPRSHYLLETTPKMYNNTHSPNFDTTLKASNIKDTDLTQWRITKISASHSFNLEDLNNLIAMMIKHKENLYNSHEVMLHPQQMKMMSNTWAKAWNIYTNTKTRIAALHKKQLQEADSTNNSDKAYQDDARDGADTEFKFHLEHTEHLETILRGIIGPKDRESVAEFLGVDREDIEELYSPETNDNNEIQYTIVTWKQAKQMIKIHNDFNVTSPGTISYRPDNTYYDSMTQGSINHITDITDKKDTLENIKMKLDSLGPTHNVKLLLHP
jgi:hypothetical protein